MMRLPNVLIWTWAILMLMLPARGRAAVQRMPSDGQLTLELHDDIDSPVYRWPRTLLTWQVDFSAANIRPDQVGVTREPQGGNEPFQLSDIQTRPDGTLASAKLSLISDLPPGGTRRFVVSGTHAKSATEPAVREAAHGNMIEIDAGAMRVRLPASREIRQGDTVPGPVLAIDRGKGWIGESQLLSPSQAVRSLTTEPIAQGPLYCEYRITYQFANGASYAATVKAVLDQPFVELRESISGLEPSDGVVVEQRWTQFNPTMRFAANGWECSPAGRRIDDPVMTGGSREEPHWTPLDFVEDPAKDMIYRLASFEGNAPRTAVPVMSFWNDQPGGQELSAFVPDTLGWNDQQYMIWQPTTRLQVHFKFKDGLLTWTWPIVNGTRRTGLALYDAAEGVRQVEATRKAFMDAAADKRNYKFQGAFYHGVDKVPLRYAQLLRSWYGALDLDRVKDWVLTYPDSARPAPQPFGPERGQSADDLEHLVLNSCVMIYPLGLDLMSMNIDHRIIRPIVDLYTRVGRDLSPAQRKRVNALLLLSAYVNSGEDLAPIRTCATGTPNMSADGFSVPSEIGLLFPDHPMGGQWRDQFQKTIELMGCYYTRPNVAAWDSLGGRWCESFGIYNWAYFAPTLAAQTADTLTDGRNRLANPWMAMRGRWMVDSLTAPVFNPTPFARQSGKVPASQPANWTPGDPLRISDGFERQYPGHGAHASGTGQSIPSDMVPTVANYLMHYDPLVAEHLLWAASQGAPGAHAEGNGTTWGNWELARLGTNTGTDPHLRSCKYTGQGFILRAGVGTPDELSIHLEQVDRGPNYRWGNNGEGSSGTIYFNAGGRVWSGHERENTGDHANDDSTGNTNFAAVSRGAYRTIGENVLDQPLYDLGVAQLATITARTGTGAYSWPAMQGRAVMLVGTDYFVLADDARGATRFSWFTAKDLPFPKLVFLEPLAVRTDALVEIETNMSKGIVRDANGPMITLVTHKADVEMEGMTAKPHPVLGNEGIQQYAWARGNRLPAGVFKVRTPTSHDWLFCNLKPVHLDTADAGFDGTAGVIRQRTDGATELALLQGTHLAAGAVSLDTPAQSRIGVSARIMSRREITGTAVAPDGGTVTVHLKETGNQPGDQPADAVGLKVYVDGQSQGAVDAQGTATLQLPVGRHRWQITAGLPTPEAPVVDHTENVSGGARIYFRPTEGATHYHLQVSTDGAKTWTAAGQGDGSPLRLEHCQNGAKVHVRLIAENADHSSEPGMEYPVYVSDQPPPTPDGLSLVLHAGRVEVTWGQVLGVHEYRLYRREQGKTDWQQRYAGPKSSFDDDDAPGTVEPAIYPTEPALGQTRVYEYAVSAVNDNGESAKSVAMSSDASAWCNWWPAGQKRQFKRVTGFWLPPYVPQEQTPPLHYPE